MTKIFPNRLLHWPKSFIIGHTAAAADSNYRIIRNECRRIGDLRK